MGFYLISLVSGDSRDRIHNFNENLLWSDFLPEDIHEVMSKNVGNTNDPNEATGSLSHYSASHHPIAAHTQRS